MRNARNCRAKTRLHNKNATERTERDKKIELAPLKKSYIPYYGHGKENSPDYRLRQRQGGRHLRHHGRTLQVRGVLKRPLFISFWQ